MSGGGGQYAQAAGSVISAVGSIKGGYAQGNAAKYQAQVAQNNATIEKQNATAAASAGAANTEAAGLKARAALSNVRAGLAANNLDINSGTAGDVQQSQHELGQLGEANVQRDAALKVYGYQTQEVNDEAQASLDKTEGKYDVMSGYMGAASDLAQNPTVDQFVDKSIGGGASSPSGAQTFEPGATGAPQSLISGPPSVPDEYAWMQSNNGLY